MTIRSQRRLGDTSERARIAELVPVANDLLSSGFSTDLLPLMRLDTYSVISTLRASGEWLPRCAYR